jgi:hypothetical protein
MMLILPPLCNNMLASLADLLGCARLVRYGQTRRAMLAVTEAIGSMVRMPLVLRHYCHGASCLRPVTMAGGWVTSGSGSHAPDRAVCDTSWTSDASLKHQQFELFVLLHSAVLHALHPAHTALLQMRQTGIL